MRRRKRKLGWILYITAQAAVKAEATNRPRDSWIQSLARLNHAVRNPDAGHVNARYFSCESCWLNEFGAFAAAQNDLQRYLIMAPNGAFAERCP